MHIASREGGGRKNPRRHPPQAAADGLCPPPPPAAADGLFRPPPLEARCASAPACGVGVRQRPELESLRWVENHERKLHDTLVTTQSELGVVRSGACLSPCLYCVEFTSSCVFTMDG